MHSAMNRFLNGKLSLYDISPPDAWQKSAIIPWISITWSVLLLIFMYSSNISSSDEEHALSWETFGWEGRRWRGLHLIYRFSMFTVPHMCFQKLPGRKSFWFPHTRVVTQNNKHIRWPIEFHTASPSNGILSDHG